MFHILDQPIQQSGGMMTLTDAFVRVNRARGLELVSPGNYFNFNLTGPIGVDSVLKNIHTV